MPFVTLSDPVEVARASAAFELAWKRVKASRGLAVWGETAAKERLELIVESMLNLLTTNTIWPAELPSGFERLLEVRRAGHETGRCRKTVRKISQESPPKECRRVTCEKPQTCRAA